MTCQQHRTYTSSTCTHCQRNRAGNHAGTAAGQDTTRNLLTQSLAFNAGASACEAPAPANYCDNTTSSFTNPGCAPSC